MVISSLVTYYATRPRSSAGHNFPSNNVLISQWTYSLFATQTKKRFRPFTSRAVTCNKEPRCGSSINYSTNGLEYLSPRITIPLKILHTSTATVSQIVQQKQAFMNHKNAIFFLGGGEERQASNLNIYTLKRSFLLFVDDDALCR